jgi:hypothetical protein
MNTLAKNHPVTFSIERADTKSKTVSEFWEKAEFYRFGITPMLLVIISCVGGVAAAAGVLESPFKLAAAALPTGIALSLVLAVTPMRLIVVSCSIALLVDLLILFF